MTAPMFTERQSQAIAAFKRGELARINIYDGSVRSGKTWITAVIWALWVSSRPIDGNFLMCGKTLTSLKRNVLDLLVDLFGARHVRYSASAKTAWIFGKQIMLEGASDARSEAKIRGLTLLGAYCDELTLFPEDFFVMLLSRISMPGAKLFATTNPDTPRHWLWRDYLSKEAVAEKCLSLRHEHFLIDDNTTLEPEYLANIKREYTGVFYDRFILGKWVAAEGLIYTIFAENHDKFIKPFEAQGMLGLGFIVVGVDFGGNKSATAFTATWVHNQYSYIHVLKSERHTRELSPDQLNGLYVQFVRMVTDMYKSPYLCYADNAEQILIRGLRMAGQAAGIPTAVVNSAKYEINDRIRATLALMGTGRFFIQEQCKNVIDALDCAVWDHKSLDDKRLDDGSTDVDSLDSFEYSWSKYISLLMSRPQGEIRR